MTSLQDPAVADAAGLPAVRRDDAVGERLRLLRQARRLTLKQVASAAGLSESFISQVERGRSSPSVASLRAMATSLGAGLHDLFSPDGMGEPSICRRQERETLAWGRGARKSLLTRPPLREVEVLVAEFEPGASTGDEPYTHGDSDEVFLVLSGRVLLQLGEQEHVLEPGDSAHYRSSTPHRVANVGDRSAETVFIIAPPSY